MNRYFNTEGLIIPSKHFYVPIDDKITQIFKMVEQSKYFVINKPRQYGKTTMFLALKNHVNKQKDYLCISISFEGLGQESFINEKNFCNAFLMKLSKTLGSMKEVELMNLINGDSRTIVILAELSDFIHKFVIESAKKIVLLIDEVDSASNNDLFIKFLGMLREKYLLAKSGDDKTFHSIILAGVHDVRNLKLKIRDDKDSSKYNSPWNIAAEFNVKMELEADKIELMLNDYKIEMNIKLDAKQLSEKIFYYTSGYPFLVSALCKIMDERILFNKEIKKLSLADLESALQIILRQENTNFESLIKNIENNNDIYNLLVDLLLKNEKKEFNIHNPLIKKCVLYGVLKTDSGKCEVHNRIYEQIIYNYLISKCETSQDNGFSSDTFLERYLDKKGRLNLEKVLKTFQSVIKSKYSKTDVLKSTEFLEKEVRLLFLVFLHPIINGVGFAFKEVETSEEKRLDIVVTFKDQKYVIELKLYRGMEAYKKGLEQLNNYLNRENLIEGYIMIFNKSKTKKFQNGWKEYKNKRIYELWF